MRVGLDAITSNLDPFTNYIAEADIEGYKLHTEGNYSGIGASYKIIEELPTIVDILNDSPAQKAGLQVGDKLIAIDGRTTKNRTEDELYAFLRGAPGTKINITIERLGQTAPIKTSITRAELSSENVPYSGILRDGVGYVHLTTFTQNASDNIAEAIKKLKKDQDLKGLVLDLRGNGGGLLNEGVSIVNLFTPRGQVVVTTRGRGKENSFTFVSQEDALDTNLPVVVLVDKFSASASEIVSGALQDFDRAVIMGQRTYGKGLVQHTRDIGYNAILKLTTAKYYIPSGRCIQAVKYENGKPVDIADSLREAFTTRAGRKVLDGGGITPDVVIVKPTDSGLLKDLADNHWIFRFANHLAQLKPFSSNIEDIRVADVDGFAQWLTQKKYTYTTETQKLLDQAIEKAAKEHNPAAVEALQKQRAALQIDHTAVLNQNKAVVISLIEKEIAGRVAFARGRTQIGLRNDPEVEQAIDLMLDQNKYKKILGK
jgi:carboxyl-terminal processing protease